MRARCDATQDCTLLCPTRLRCVAQTRFGKGFRSLESYDLRHVAQFHKAAGATPRLTPRYRISARQRSHLPAVTPRLRALLWPLLSDQRIGTEYRIQSRVSSHRRRRWTICSCRTSRGNIEVHDPISGQDKLMWYRLRGSGKLCVGEPATDRVCHY